MHTCATYRCLLWNFVIRFFIGGDGGSGGGGAGGRCCRCEPRSFITSQFIELVRRRRRVNELSNCATAEPRYDGLSSLRQQSVQRERATLRLWSCDIVTTDCFTAFEWVVVVVGVERWPIARPPRAEAFTGPNAQPFITTKLCVCVCVCVCACVLWAVVVQFLLVRRPHSAVRNSGLDSADQWSCILNERSGPTVIVHTASVNAVTNAISVHSNAEFSDSIRYCGPVLYRVSCLDYHVILTIGQDGGRMPVNSHFCCVYNSVFHLSNLNRNRLRIFPFPHSICQT